VEYLWAALGVVALLILRFFGEMFLEIALEVLVKGAGAGVLSLVFRQKNVDPDRWPSLVTGLALWAVLFTGAGWAAYSAGVLDV